VGSVCNLRRGKAGHSRSARLLIHPGFVRSASDTIACVAVACGAAVRVDFRRCDLGAASGCLPYPAHLGKVVKILFSHWYYWPHRLAVKPLR